MICASGQVDPTNIKIENGSFEGEPSCCTTPNAWADCGFENETPPDIQPAWSFHQALYGVRQKAFHWNTYLAMVTRENGTYERVSQKLSTPMLKDRCYAFSIYLMMSAEYKSAVSSDSFRTIRYFDNPVILKIYGIDRELKTVELLAESSPVSNSIWQKYDFELGPQSEMAYFILEAYYDPKVKEFYNGNLLLDHASDLKLISCKTDSEEK